MSKEFLSGSWQYWTILLPLPSASLFCFGQFVFKVACNCVVSITTRKGSRNIILC